MSDPQDRQAEPDITQGYGVSFSPVRWHPYKPTSQEVKRGKKGRWQMMNEWGGWHNCEKPSHIVQDPQAIMSALSADKHRADLERLREACAEAIREPISAYVYDVLYKMRMPATSHAHQKTYEPAQVAIRSIDIDALLAEDV